MCKVVKLDVTALKEILKKDTAKLSKLLTLVSHRILAVYYDKFPSLT
jgi:hypothetical protein